MIYIIAFFVIILAISLFFSVKKLLQLNEKLENVVLQIEESLDILDACYSKIHRKSKTELFLDDPIVKELVSDINETKKAILLVANKISDKETLTFDNENK